ncbi:anti-virulence regulator CigR family protein [Pseudomonas sp. NPDC089530]|uniref:anti-virulence regulator CigR family protein n=1 Tax=Pseudomonas sp. NPDC089530 TaxID=3390651 RepID=UPI003D04744B
MTTRSVVAVLTSAALLLGSTALQADPGNGKGNPHGNQGGHGNKGHQSQDYRQGGPQVDIGGIRVIIGDSRDYWSPGPALPPGIQKNLARGKPLPPGIAKKLDSRMLGRLPRYDGYEWQQAGTDLILVALATGLIYEVLHDALD